ncbi:unnamed protein product [Sphagnum jensenii]|uniref:Uncharacterized protein n=1 Tax=Sphagnum jensenii TaxID=128206 RepID=A0ABP1B570_9BRYO
MSTSDHKTHHGPDSGVCHHRTPLIVYSVTLHGGYIQMAQIPETLEMESRNRPGWSPGTLGAHNSRLQARIATRSEPNL